MRFLKRARDGQTAGRPSVLPTTGFATILTIFLAFFYILEHFEEKVIQIFVEVHVAFAVAVRQNALRSCLNPPFALPPQMKILKAIIYIYMLSSVVIEKFLAGFFLFAAKKFLEELKSWRRRK